MNRPLRISLSALALLLAGAAPGAAQAPAAPPGFEVVTLPSPGSPLVSVRAMFHAGSIYDPPGKEGLSALTAMMVGASGTGARTYAELIEAFYPMAADIEVFTDREVVVFASQVHRDTLGDFTTLFEETLLRPGFREDDFTRNRDQLRSFLTTTLRSANDELLGLEMIQQVIFEGHPYGHAPAGTVAGLAAITLDDVRRFYKEHYTRANLILGIGGGYDDGYQARLTKALSALPAGEGGRKPLPPPPAVKGRQVTIVDKQADSVGIHFGYPLPITRKDDEFYPLLVANSYLGEHRTFHGRLMQELRGKRGLNYGDYSYLEYWEDPPGTQTPPANHPRRQQYFSVWVRPVVPGTALFAFRAAVSEVERLIARGLTQEEFELTRAYLVSYSKLWARSLSDRLAFHMDSRFYGMPYFIDHVERQLSGLTLEAVNQAVKKHLQADDFRAVIIAGDGAKVRDLLTEGRPSPLEYASPPPPEVREADRAIEVLSLRPAKIAIIPVQETFEGKAARAPGP